MELVISPEALRQELRVFQNLVAREAALMEVSNLKIETAGTRVFIYGTDLDVSLRTEIGEDSFEAVKPGAICVKAHKLIDVLNTLDNRVRSVRLRAEQNGWTSFMFGRSHFKISGIKSELFPEVPYENPGVGTVAFPAGLLMQFLAATGYAIAAQDTQFTITGANLVVGDGAGENKARMTSTDGFRVAAIEADIAGSFTALIPKKAGNVLAKLLGELSPEVLVEISEDSNHVFLTLGAKRLVFRKLAGTFPNVAPILKQSNDLRVLVDLYELRSAIRRADIFADKNNQSSIQLTVRNGEIEIHAKSFEEGSGNEVIPAEYNGPEVKIKLRSSYLVDFFNSVNNLDSSNNPTLCMEFSESEAIPTVWKIHTDGAAAGFDYSCVITKLR